MEGQVEPASGRAQTPIFPLYRWEVIALASVVVGFIADGGLG